MGDRVIDVGLGAEHGALGDGPWVVMGPSRSGKTTLARSLAYPVVPYHVCDPLRHLLSRAGVAPSDRALLLLADAIRAAAGPGALARLALDQRRPLVVEGVRLPAEAAVMRRAGYTTIFVDTPARLRLARIEITGFSPVELDQQAEGLKELADFVIAGYGCGLSAR